MTEKMSKLSSIVKHGVKIIKIVVLILILISSINGIFFRFDGEVINVRWDIEYLRFLVEETEMLRGGDFTSENGVVETVEEIPPEIIWINDEIAPYGFSDDDLRFRMDDLANTTVVFIVDSPGGYISEIQQCLDYLQWKKRDGRLTYISYVYTALSGAYLLTALSDKIYVSPIAMIGGLGSVFYIRNLDWLGMEAITQAPYKNLTAGELTKEQREMLFNLLENIDTYYTEYISDTRKLNKTFVKESLMTGYVFTSKQALENGLIDEITTYQNFRENEIENFINKWDYNFKVIFDDQL